MDKKVTIKDVAREAGVSVATVSYIMNNREDVKIGAETRKKVLQIANLLNYTPSSTAKSLATGRNNIIGISYRLNEKTLSRNLELIGFTKLLTERLDRLGYDVLFLPVNPSDESIHVRHNIDGIIAIDLSSTEFKSFSDRYLVPIIAVDMLVQDDLFYQVYTNLQDTIKKLMSNDAQTVLATDPYSNELYMESITSSADKERLFLLTDFDVEKGKFLNGKKLLSIGTLPAMMLSPYISSKDITVIGDKSMCKSLPSGVKIIENENEKKANMAINLLLNAIDHKFDVKHTYGIDLEAD